MTLKVSVIGAGVIGLSSAYRLKEANPEIDVTVYADSFTPNTLSDGAAGYWEPFIPGSTSQSLVRSWCGRTYKYVLDLIKNDPEAAMHGLYPMTSFELRDVDLTLPYWSDLVLDLHVLTKEEVRTMFPPSVVSGFCYTTVFIEGNRYLPWIMKKYWLQPTVNEREVLFFVNCLLVAIQHGLKERLETKKYLDFPSHVFNFLFSFKKDKRMGVVTQYGLADFPVSYFPRGWDQAVINTRGTVRSIIFPVSMKYFVGWSPKLYNVDGSMKKKIPVQRLMISFSKETCNS